ncbi:MAG: hypothetical protein C5B48_16210 [Candidatus Rokuibacteriota bacterium]|nr:MAG: hypothetical protein C5B48_16210 [Candidatus Rokubacteria bacterium]
MSSRMLSVMEPSDDIKDVRLARPAPRAYNDNVMREYRYVVDRDGRMFHDGTEIIDPPTLRFFLLAMQQLPDGRYLAVCQGERNWFETADTPFVVQRLRCDEHCGQLVSMQLELAGGHREPLDPASLEADDGYLYCRVRSGAFRARFGRAAVQHLAPFLLEDDAGLALLLGGARYPIGRPQPNRDLRDSKPGQQ